LVHGRRLGAAVREKWCPRFLFWLPSKVRQRNHTREKVKYFSRAFYSVLFQS
jgi:hypothetical protein